jgi:hypothetical protein
VKRLYKLAANGFAISVILAYLIVNLIPFDSYSIAWDSRQLVYFLLYYLSLTFPFIFVGLGIGGALAVFREQNHQVYASNLAGSAFGVLLAPLLMWFAGVPGAFLASIALGLSAAMEWNRRPPTIAQQVNRTVIIGISVIFILLGWFNLNHTAPLGMTISPYKGLAQALRIPGSRVLYQRWNEISRIDVVAGGATRVLPGLSYTFPDRPPEQLGLSIDGDSLQPISLVDPEQFDAAAFLPEAAAFLIRPEAGTLVLEPGGGLGVIQTLASGSGRVTAVSNNPLLAGSIEATADRFNVFEHPRVSLVIAPPRQYLHTQGESFDIVYLPLTESFKPVASGAYSLTETYLYTIEGFEDILAKLSPKGLFVATRWLQTPPSEEVKLVATALDALENYGIDHPSEKIVSYRGIQTLTLIVQSDGWSATELARIRQFCEALKYDLVWAPDISEKDVNRFNRLPSDDYFKAIDQLVKSNDRELFYDEFTYAINPATDNRPFFSNFFKLRQTPEVLETIGHVWQPFGGSGYLVILALLVLVLGLSSILIGMPYLVRVKRGNPDRPATLHERDQIRFANKFRVILYFSSIGLAYLLIEIPLIQRGILSFGHSTYSFTLVVLVLLLTSSVGSLFSRKYKFSHKWGMASLVGIALITTVISGRLAEITLGWNVLPKALLTGIMLCPLGLLIGIPFPAGLNHLVGNDPVLVSWAWAINGCASVVASVLAAILVLTYGFDLVLGIGTGFYALAALIINVHR